MTCQAPSWLAAPLSPSPSVRRISVGEREALFCERRQQLFELDAAAAVIWDGLAAGLAVQAVAEVLAAQGLPPATTATLCLARAREWSEAGWFTPRALAHRLAARPSQVLPLRLGPMAARLELRLQDEAIWRHVQDAFGQFAENGDAATDALHLDVVALGPRYFLVRDRVPVSLLAPERVVPELKALLTEALCGRPLDGGLWLHAALLSSGGGGLLLAGAPGAGKTTLAVALATRGFGYATDDLVGVARDGEVAGIRYSPALKAGGWPLLASRLPPILDLPIHLRADGQQVRYLPADRLAAAESGALRWTVLLDRQGRGTATLNALDPLTALTELLGSAYAADHRLAGDTLAALAARFAHMDCRRLVYSDLDEAAGAIAAMTDG